MKKRNNKRKDPLIRKSIFLTLLLSENPLPEDVLKARAYIIYRFFGGKKKW